MTTTTTTRTTTTTATTTDTPTTKTTSTPHYNNYCYNFNFNYTTTTTTATATTTTSLQYIQELWVRRPLQPFWKAQLQPPFGPSVDSFCHPCITTTHLSYSCLSIIETSATDLCGTTGIHILKVRFFHVLSTTVIRVSHWNPWQASFELVSKTYWRFLLIVAKRLASHFM